MSAPASVSYGATPRVRALFLATATLTFCMSFMASLYTLFALSDLALSPAELGVTIGCGGDRQACRCRARGARGYALRPASYADRRLARRRRSSGADPARASVPAIAMTMLIATQVIGDGALTVYLINETTLRQRLLPAESARPRGSHVAGRHRAPDSGGALAGAALAESIGMRPTLWMLAIGIALAAAWLAVARRAIPGRPSFAI